MPISDPAQSGSTGNLRRLFVLRNLMIGGVTLVILGVQFLLQTPLPLATLFGILGLLALVNLWTWKRVNSDALIGNHEIFLQLGVDVLALTALLYFTGGASNPFAWLYLIPLMIAATVLSARLTWIMAGLTIACYTLLMMLFEPMAGSEHMHHDQGFTQHIFGMWFGFVFSAALIAWFVVGMAKSLRERDRRLAEAREQALRDEQLVALGTLATGAAHELGTPLGTMAILTGELQRNAETESDQRKLSLLREQIERCKQALSVISASAGEARAESGSLRPVRDFIEEIIDEWQQLRPGAQIEVRIDDSDTTACIMDETTLRQSLINLLNNAADASPQNLALETSLDENCLQIDILDRGPGLHPRIANRLGTTQSSSKEFGMGLGLFLTHATVGRLGGDIELFDRDGGGTCTRIRLALNPTEIPHGN